MFSADAFVDDNYSRINPFYDYDQVASENVATWQRSLRNHLGALLGTTKLRLLHRNVELSAKRLRTMLFLGHACEEWTITSEPGFNLPFYYFKPRGSIDTKSPLLIVVHGHNTFGREVFLSSESREFELVSEALKKGYAVITPAVRAFGELERAEDREAGKPNSCEELQRRSLLFGRTLMGDRVYDIMRLLDFAAKQTDIDENNIILNGHSGGGAVTLLTGALDERISIAIPASYFCTFKASFLSIRHCMCNVIPGIIELGEMADIAALFFPRPLLIIHGSKDEIFPVEATHSEFARIKRFYENSGLGKRCELAVGDFGHSINSQPMWSFIEKFIT